MLEHIIASNIYAHLESNNFFFTNQHGFRKGHSCETQLFEFTTDLHSNMNSNLQTDCLFLDFAKAFDRVAHCRLILKLSSLKLDSLTLTWLRNFLTNRQQFTIANNHSSSLCYVSSGVPQGSVLGPLLFLIYINDLPDNLSSCMRIFADDSIIYRPIRNNSDHLTLQKDLEHIIEWCKTWQMTLNVSKCKLITFSRKRDKFDSQYKIDNSNVERTDHYKYLGINLTSTLSWSTHITSICANTSRSLGFLCRNLYSAPSDVRKLAYLALIRPQLEFASSIWSPYQQYLIDKLECIQNRASRFIARNHSYPSSVTQIKHSLALEPLKIRRDISLLSLFHKLIHTSMMPSVHLNLAHRTSSRLHNTFSLSRMYGNTNAFNQSALPRAIRLWNDLPDDLASEQDHTKFYHTLKKYLCTKNCSIASS